MVKNKAQHFAQWCFLSLIFAIFTTAKALNYGDALAKSLLYFESQRSGRLPYNQRVTWRDHSGLTDGLEQGVDLVGGYYDAGDHVKFGLPMAFTVTMLSWSVIEYRQQIADAGELEHAMEAIKWGTDYFIKAHTSPNVLWAEVGDGDTDHYCWQRPEDMTTSRQAYKIDQNNPGSDLAGETAAAMAAAALVFKKTNPHYAHLLLHHAQQLFEFGDKYRGKYDEAGRMGVVKSYYASVSGFKDELLWAALWLYKATDNEEYLRYVINEAENFGGIGWAITEFSWDVKYAGIQVMASKLLNEEKSKKHSSTLEKYRSKAEYYICSCLNKNIDTKNVERTPAGLLYIRQWNNMQYVSTASFLLTMYSDFLKSSNQKLSCHGGIVGHQEILSFAKTQVDYILGSNPSNMSYLVGYGPNYPQRVHHRGASVVSYRENKAFIGCTQGYDNWYGRVEPNPNVLVGALVGGPDSQDNFVDQRDNYMGCQVFTINGSSIRESTVEFLSLSIESRWHSSPFMGASLSFVSVALSYVSDLGLLPLFSALFFSFGLPLFSFHLAPIFFLNFIPKFDLTHSALPITFFHPPSLISRSSCMDFFYSISNRYQDLVFAVASLKRDFSRSSWKIGRALARVHAPPPSLFYFWGLLAPPGLGFICLDLFSKLWLQISCYGANLYCGEEDIYVFRSSFFVCLSIFRVILIGLWCRGPLPSCNFGVPCSNSATTAILDVGGTGFVAAEEDVWSFPVLGFVTFFPSFFLLL